MCGFSFVFFVCEKIAVLKVCHLGRTNMNLLAELTNWVTQRAISFWNEWLTLTKSCKCSSFQPRRADAAPLLERVTWVFDNSSPIPNLNRNVFTTPTFTNFCNLRFDEHSKCVWTQSKTHKLLRLLVVSCRKLNFRPSQFVVKIV